MNIIKSISVKNFRSHQNFSLSCNKPTTLIIGENGSGKTSILEAVYLAMRGKSFKGTDAEMIRRDADYYRVELSYIDREKIIIRYNGSHKEFDVAGKKSRRLPVKYQYPVILFEPDNLHLVGSSPARRRDYFDHLFSQMDEQYSIALRKYARALKQRNDLLKNTTATPDNVFSWDIMLARYGTELSLKRQANISKINQTLTDVYREIAKNTDNCHLHYTGTIVDENHYLKTLTNNFERDRIYGHTSFGIHRDDYEFIFNHTLASGSASRGEIRSIILALKFIEASIINEAIGKNPLVLLDDIFSELDEARQTHLIKNFKNHQIIITSTTTPKNLPIDIEL
ncbi:MAG: DNA replication and repair protein RecF [Candidatus Nomurabacteria bacterium]|jgi:DNA replication and repair protein RecF|nr:DNA replication and repair protein RecF [Candidatus Nomurabacteria bacterium]